MFFFFYLMFIQRLSETFVMIIDTENKFENLGSPTCE